MNLLHRSNTSNKQVIYADKGYIGEEINRKCQIKGYNLVTPPKKLRNSKYSHYVDPYQSIILKRIRPRIEHVNSYLKNFRGFACKYDRKISSYHSLVTLASLLVSIKSYLNQLSKSRHLIVLKRKNL